MPAELESHLLTFSFSAMFQTVNFYYKHTHTHAEHVCQTWALTYGVSTATRQNVSALMQKGGCLSCQKAWHKPSLYKHSNPSVVYQFPLYLKGSEGSTLMFRGRACSELQRTQSPSLTPHPMNTNIQNLGTQTRGREGRENCSSHLHM